MTIRNFFWVKETQISAFLELGWKQADQKPTRHSAYATLMEWPSDTSPILPKIPADKINIVTEVVRERTP